MRSDEVVSGSRRRSRQSCEPTTYGVGSSGTDGRDDGGDGRSIGHLRRATFGFGRFGKKQWLYDLP